MKLPLGKYNSYDTFLHRMDSRIKLVGRIIRMVSVFLSYGNQYRGLIVRLGLFIILMVLSLLGKASFGRLFSSLKVLWRMVLILVVINIFLPKYTRAQIEEKGLAIAFRINTITVTYAAIINIVYIIVRLVLVLRLTNIFTATTKPRDRTNAREWLLAPLKLLFVPVHKIARSISLALRFIPTLTEETDRIRKAQASRGVDFHQGKLKDKRKSLISLIIPLFMSAFSISGELADARESRGYDPNAKRTKYRAFQWSTRDTLGVIFLAARLGSIIYLAIRKYDRFAYLGINLPKIS